jgi:esterase/lipase superfamily enzyme
MNREYHKWYSSRLNRDMELLVFGHAGTPVLVFPTSRGRFFEYSDRGMIDAVSDKINRGR